MNSALLTVEEVAQNLNLHVRTIRRYIREGRLAAVRIGKEYRISPSQLQQLTGAPVRRRHSEASVVVQIDVIDPSEAQRVMNGVGGAIKGRDRDSDTPLRVDTIYDETRARLKIIINGSLKTSSALMRLIEAY
jgi:excisionase family DNA binding protein